MKTKQHGTTVIEVLGAVAVGTLMLLGLTSMIDTSLDDTKGEQAALYQARVADAARKYISANYKTLKDTVYEPQLVATISVNDLINQNFLPSGFSLVNVYKQSTCVLVRQPVQGSGKLEALVATSGGQAIEDKIVRVVAAHAGEGGGYIAAATPTTAQGTAWSVDTVNYQGVDCAGSGMPVLSGTASDGGHLVSNLFYDGPGYTDFLYRFAIDGRPDLNKMYTPLRFTGDAILAEDTGCGDYAAVTFNASRELLYCDGDKKWKRVTPWRAAVATYADLAAIPDAKAGDMRMVNDKHRAFVYTGTAWQALAVDQDGNLVVEGNLQGARVIAQDVMITPELALNGDPAAWNPGDACHVPVVMPDGSTEIWYAMGTIVRTTDGYSLICKRYTPDLAAEYPAIPAPSTGYAWTYPNGKFAP